MIDHTHDPGAVAWVESAQGHPDFPVQNLPFGIFSPAGGKVPRGGLAIGDFVLDLAAVADLLPNGSGAAARKTGTGTLNALMASGALALRALRHDIFRLLTNPAERPRVQPHLHPMAQCQLHLPFAIGDYTDFYTGIHHAENIGRIFRPDNPLLPNYKYVPIGYHGRSSSVRVSGVNLRRPHGQTRGPGQDVPAFGPSRRLDYELEMAIWIGQGNDLGSPIPVGEASAHIAGLSLLNDWSARDIQAWEYQPLGPFLAKSFHTTVSPWVVTLDALAPFRSAQPARPDGDPAPLPYLHHETDQAQGAFDISMEVLLTTAAMRDTGLPPHRLSQGSTLAMYWTAAQLVAHHASNGCNLAPGDLLGTGTLSGPTESSFGSLMEITGSGSRPILLPTGESRTFLEDGDEIIMTAHAEAQGFARIGFGTCTATVLA